MSKKSRFFSSGFIDVLSLVAVVFLVATVITGTLAVNNKKTNYNIQNKAATSCSSTNGSCLDPYYCCAGFNCNANNICVPASGSTCSGTCDGKPYGSFACSTSTQPVQCGCSSGKTYPDWISLTSCTSGQTCDAGTGTCKGSTTPTSAPIPTSVPIKSPTPPTSQCSAGQIKCEGSGQLYSCYAGSWIMDVKCSTGNCNSTGTACGTSISNIINTYTCTQTSGQYCARDCTYGSGSGTCQTGQVCCKPADPTLVCSIQGQVKCVGSQLYNCSSGYWYPGANCASGSCNAAGTACTPIASCITTNGLGSTRCKTTSTASYVETCSSNGTWTLGIACTGTCSNGLCSDCAAKPNVCNNAGGVNYCQGGKYYSKDCPSGTTCVGGQCTTPTNCVARDVCLKEGESCCSGIDKVRASGCSTGLKCGSCLAGQTRCGGSGATAYSETCQGDGSWIKASCSNGCSGLDGKCLTSPPKKDIGIACSNNSECSSGFCMTDKQFAAAHTGAPPAWNATTTCISRDVAKQLDDLANKIGLAGSAVGITVTGGAAAAIAPTALTATYVYGSIYGSAALATLPPGLVKALGTATSFGLLAQGPIAIYTCVTYGAYSSQCQDYVTVITSGYFANPAETIQSLSSSAQTIENNVLNPISALNKKIFNKIANGSLGNAIFGNPSLTSLEPPSLAMPGGSGYSGTLGQRWTTSQVKNYNDPAVFPFIDELEQKLNRVTDPFDPTQVRILDRQVSGVGTKQFRAVVEVQLPTGEALLCYRSSGTCTPGLKKLGDWQVIPGFAENGWYMKTAGSIALTKPGGNPYAFGMAEYLSTFENLIFPEYAPLPLPH